MSLELRSTKSKSVSSMKVIIMNGPCGVGKSTAVSAVHADDSRSFLIDVDAQSRFIAHYADFENREYRWDLTIEITHALMDLVLARGENVYIDKMVYAPETIDSYYKFAKKHGAEVIEIIMWADKETVMKRAEDRGWHDGGLLTPEKCEMFWHKIEELKKERPKAHVLDTTNLNPKEVIEEVKKIIKQS